MERRSNRYRYIDMSYRYFSITLRYYQKIKLMDIIHVSKQQWAGHGT